MDTYTPHKQVAVYTIPNMGRGVLLDARDFDGATAVTVALSIDEAMAVSLALQAAVRSLRAQNQALTTIAADGRK